MSRPAIRQTVARGLIPRHRHMDGYVAVVLSGAYEEAGDRGRRRLVAGDVAAHGAWEAHLNRASGTAEVLNLPLPPGTALAPFGRVRDVDALVRAATVDPTQACEMLVESYQAATPADEDWPQRLAHDLEASPALSLGAWAEAQGLSREHVARGFRQMFGVAPSRFRWEARCRAVLAVLPAGATPLAELALAHGFADQAHMTRAVRAITGRSPGDWRRSHSFKTVASDAGI